MYFTESHEWIKVENDIGTVGISNYARKELGEIVSIELPKLNQKIKVGDQVSVLESTKAAADIYSPVSGTIQAINENLNQSTELINTSAEDQGWLFKIRLSNVDEVTTLMSREKYTDGTLK